MRINKDLTDAVMMLSFITLVLVGTTDMSDTSTKDITMGVLGFVTFAMFVLRIIHARQMAKHPDNEYEY